MELSELPEGGRDALGRGDRAFDTEPEVSTDRSPHAWLRLSMLPGVGPRTLASLLDVFETPRRVLAASASELAAVEGVGPKLIHAIRTASHHVDADSILGWCDANGVRLLCQGEEDYPVRLEDLNDPPPLLFVRGALIADDELAVAVVGTRHATAYGLRQAERFGYGLARAGVTVVSGLARGIDSASHQGALAAGGRTLAVLGSGLGEVYPAEHRDLAESIAGSGAVISEFAPDAKPRAGMFPQRNRLIAGLSLAALVIEAPDRSGALITARIAGEQGREVLALPGAVTSRASRGCNQLIRDGATLVQSVDDVLEALGPIRQPVASSATGSPVRNGSELTLNDLERQVLSAIGAEATPIDQVIETSGLPAHRVVATVTVLEMRRLVRRLGGQAVARI